MYQNNNDQENQLKELSQMVICGQITYKLDHIASIYINNRYYFNVFRRYNSPYNIIIKDNNNDIYLHQDYTIRSSLKNILCLPEYMSNSIYSLNVTSYKHNGEAPRLSTDISDLRWTDIHAKYAAVVINFGGIFNVYEHNIPSDITSNVYEHHLESEENSTAQILITLSVPTENNQSKLNNTDDSTYDENKYTILRSGTILRKL